MSEGFDGFPVDALVYLDDLAANNNTAWFDANRLRYDEGLIEPARAFVDELGGLLRDAVPNIVADPRIDRSIFRTRRDTRFSNDKSPYKTNLAIILWEGTARTTSPGFYVGLESTRLFVGGGAYQLDKDGLARYRAAASEDESGEALEQIEADLSAQGIALQGRSYKRVPRGFAPDHPRADLLRHSGVFVGTWDGEPPEALHTAEFAGWVAERLAPIIPLHRWLVRHVGG